RRCCRTEPRAARTPTGAAAASPSPSTQDARGRLGRAAPRDEREGGVQVDFGARGEVVEVLAFEPGAREALQPPLDHPDLFGLDRDRYLGTVVGSAAGSADPRLCVRSFPRS